MAVQATSQAELIGERTEPLDALACLDARVLRKATTAVAAEPGSYLQVQGIDQAVLVPLRRIGVTHIGRGLVADLRLDDCSVSRRHAILVHRYAGVRVLDDRSSNGTFVNGRRVEQADLRDGDVLMLGRVELRYLEL
jgi:pSer/pThr/pTyr-binding forkhead associated (FHA) protein